MKSLKNASIFIIFTSIFIIVGWLSFVYINKTPLATIKMYISKDHIYSVRSINDLYLIIDTGQTHDLVIEESVFSHFDPKKTNQTDSLTTIKDKFTDIPIFHINQLNLENFKINHVSCMKEISKVMINDILVECYSNSHDHVTTHGGLGMGVLSRYNFKLDYLNRKVTLFKKGVIDPSLAKETHIKVAYKDSHHPLLPVVELETNHGTKKFLIDTGSTISFISTKNREKYDITLHNNLEVIEMQLASNDIQLMKSMFFLVDTNDAFEDIDGVLGYNIIANFTLFFDTQKNHVYFLKPMKSKTL